MIHIGLVRLPTAVTALAMTLVPAAQGQDASSTIRKLPQDIQFKGLVGGAQVAVLLGDPAKPGLYVMRTRFPKGLKSMPHFHPESQRAIVVLSGTLYYGLGEVWDETKLQPLPQGTFFSEPKGLAHFWWAKDGDVIVQITGLGPWGTTSLHKADGHGVSPGEGSSP